MLLPETPYLPGKRSGSPASPARHASWNTVPFLECLLVSCSDHNCAILTSARALGSRIRIMRTEVGRPQSLLAFLLGWLFESSFPVHQNREAKKKPGCLETILGCVCACVRASACIYAYACVCMSIRDQRIEQDRFYAPVWKKWLRKGMDEQLL